MQTIEYADGTLNIEERDDGWYWKWKDLNWQGPVESEKHCWKAFENLDTSESMYKCLQDKLKGQPKCNAP